MATEEFTTPSINEIAACLVAGLEPIGLARASRDRIAVRFPAAASDVVAAFNDARDRAARLLDPEHPSIPAPARRYNLRPDPRG